MGKRMLAGWARAESGRWGGWTGRRVGWGGVDGNGEGETGRGETGWGNLEGGNGEGSNRDGKRVAMGRGTTCGGDGEGAMGRGREAMGKGERATGRGRRGGLKGEEKKKGQEDRGFHRWI